MYNYNDYDKLTLYVKKNKLKQIIKNYEMFGWELVEEKENKRYEDIKDLIFIRPHKINNKDEMQLQQVYMEEKLNELGKLEKHKHDKTTVIGLTIGIFVIALLGLAVGSLINFKSVLGLVLCIVLGVVGIAVGVAGIVVLRKVGRREKEFYSQRKRVLENQVKKITELASKLLRGEDGKD